MPQALLHAHRWSFLLCTLLLAHSPLTSADHADLWIISGQSNACGRAKLPGPAPRPAVQFHDPEKQEWLVAEDPLPGMGTSGVGPWVAAAQVAAAQVVGARIAAATDGPAVRCLGYARGAQPISHWDPGAPGDTTLLDRIEAAGQGAGVFLWFQGETDAMQGTDPADYVTRLKQLVERVRKQAGNPKMTAVIVQLGAWTRPDRSPNFLGIREAQRRFVLLDPDALLVPALGRTMKDGAHLDRAGQLELGVEIGRALLRRRFGTTTPSWPGPVLDRAVLSSAALDSAVPERAAPASAAPASTPLNSTVPKATEPSRPRKITAHFAEVKELHGARAPDFAVVDSQGTALCIELQAGKTLLKLSFERDLVLPAQLIYGYGNGPQATLVDEAGNRAPAVHLGITKGAVPAERETAAPNGAGPTP